MLTMWSLNSNCEFPIIITHSCVARMDGGWTGNIFPLGSNPLANHGAWMLFLLFTSEQPTSPYLYTYHLHASTWYLVATYYPYIQTMCPSYIQITYLPTDLSFTIAKVKTDLNSGVRPAIPSPPTPSMRVSIIVYLIQQVSVHKPKLHPFYYVRTLKIDANGDGLRGKQVLAKNCAIVNPTQPSNCCVVVGHVF